MMKKIIALLLALMLCLSFAACNANDDKLAEMQKEIDALKGADGSEGTGGAANTVYAINATINGEKTAEISGKTSLEAKAEPAEGMVVDYWTVDGVKQEDATGETFQFDAETTCVVEPVLRAEKKVTGINAKFQFVDDKQKAGGEEFTEFVFEKEYTNTASNQQVTDGTIAIEVKADLPKGYTVDYWLINGVQYELSQTSFVVVGLDEATTYEAVLKEIPVTYYKLTCVYCNWKGKTSASIAAGSTVTINMPGKDVGQFVVNGVAVTDKYAKSCTFTMKQDTTVIFYATIN